MGQNKEPGMGEGHSEKDKEKTTHPSDTENTGSGTKTTDDASLNETGEKKQDTGEQPA